MSLNNYSQNHEEVFKRSPSSWSRVSTEATFHECVGRTSCCLNETFPWYFQDKKKGFARGFLKLSNASKRNEKSFATFFLAEERKWKRKDIYTRLYFQSNSVFFRLYLLSYLRLVNSKMWHVDLYNSFTVRTYYTQSRTDAYTYTYLTKKTC